MNINGQNLSIAQTGFTITVTNSISENQRANPAAATVNPEPSAREEASPVSLLDAALRQDIYASSEKTRDSSLANALKYSAEQLRNIGELLSSIREGSAHDGQFSILFRKLRRVRSCAVLTGLPLISRLAFCAERMANFMRAGKLDLGNRNVLLFTETVNTLENNLILLKTKGKDGIRQLPEPNLLFDNLESLLKTVVTTEEDLLPRKVLPAVVEPEPVPTPEPVAEPAVEEPVVPSAEEAVPDTAPPEPVAPPAPELPARRPETTPEKRHAEAARIVEQGLNKHKLAKIIETVGLLVEAEAKVSQSEELKNTASDAMRHMMGKLDKITSELQSLGVSLNLHPVRDMFRRLADGAELSARRYGRQVKVEIESDNLEFEEPMLKDLESCLGKFLDFSVRNGIEQSPEVRASLGKNPVARIILRSVCRAGHLLLEIEDDGCGLDKDYIAAQAMRKGLLKLGQELPDQELLELAFHPDVDAVPKEVIAAREKIEKANGKFLLKSVRGCGSIYSFRLPLPRMVMDAVRVSAGEDDYLIPMLGIVETAAVRGEDIAFNSESNKLELKYNGELLPVVDLEKFFADEGPRDFAPDSDLTVVILAEDGRKAAVVVDAALDHRLVTVRNLGTSLNEIEGISGGAQTADGSLVLIVDVDYLIKFTL